MKVHIWVENREINHNISYIDLAKEKPNDPQDGVWFACEFSSLKQHSTAALKLGTSHSAVWIEKAHILITLHSIPTEDHKDLFQTSWSMCVRWGGVEVCHFQDDWEPPCHSLGFWVSDLSRGPRCPADSSLNAGSQLPPLWAWGPPTPPHGPPWLGELSAHPLWAFHQRQTPL